MMVELNSVKSGVFLLPLDRVHMIHPLVDGDVESAAIILMGGEPVELEKSYVQVKQLLDGGGVKIIRG